MKTKEQTKYQVIGDGELYNKVYDLRRDATTEGELLVSIGWIDSFEVVGVKATWLRA